MYCLICEPIVKLKETRCTEEYNMYYQFYICPNCLTEFICSSQSGDMVYENLDYAE